MTRPYRFLLRNKVRDQLSRERWSELLIQSDHHAFPVCWWLITTRYENYVSLNLYYTTALLVWESRNRVRRTLWSREHQTRPGYLGTGRPPSGAIWHIYWGQRNIPLYQRDVYSVFLSAFSGCEYWCFPWLYYEVYEVLWTQKKRAHDFHIAVMSPI